MTIPHNKNELLKAINTSFEKLFNDLKAVPAERTSEPGMEGHVKNTRIGVSNLVAYLLAEMNWS
ncbi:ClbS/DfsB family four-helix bundle protein [Agrobacterium fabrum]|uniref:ClbS/DfsB family four-helix bundle protein n=1 Tax=Agrobacterium fabrum TaxID=1176649 RepID=UPI003BA34A99